MTGALAGVAAGAAALGAAELLAGILPGAASPIVAIGDLIISLQPPGAKQFIVDIFGEADKLALNLLIVGVALAVAAGLGILAIRREPLARIGFAGFGLLALGASLGDPLASPLTSLVVAGVAVGVASWVLHWLLGIARSAASPAEAEMPAWKRRRFLIGTGSLLVASFAGGVVGRTLARARAARGDVRRLARFRRRRRRHPRCPEAPSWRSTASRRSSRRTSASTASTRR